jgi:adenosylcobinamide amidohydrolase
MQQLTLRRKRQAYPKRNVLAVLSGSPLKAVGSAFHNGGGIKETNVILNIEVPKGYGNVNLHMDPEALIAESAKKLGLQEDFVAMITAACVRNFALSSKREDDIGVSVIATAADDDGNTVTMRNRQVNP